MTTCIIQSAVFVSKLFGTYKENCHGKCPAHNMSVIVLWFHGHRPYDERPTDFIHDTHTRTVPLKMAVQVAGVKASLCHPSNYGARMELLGTALPVLFPQLRCTPRPASCRGAPLTGLLSGAPPGETELPPCPRQLTTRARFKWSSACLAAWWIPALSGLTAKSASAILFINLLRCPQYIETVSWCKVV